MYTGLMAVERRGMGFDWSIFGKIAKAASGAVEAITKRDTFRPTSSQRYGTQPSGSYATPSTNITPWLVAAGGALLLFLLSRRR
jgi:MYXO-CTERM domain-containing protein